MEIRCFIAILLLFFLSGNAFHFKVKAIDQVQTEEQKPKAIYLISTPRSCSTAFLRMMHVRGDFKIFNEPGVQTYLYLHQPDRQSVLKSYQEVKNHILQKEGSQRSIFVKELGYAAYEYLFPESDFFKKQDYHLTFLVRHPHSALISHYKKLRFGVMHDILKDIMSYKKLYELFKRFQQSAINTPRIILSEELTAYPEKVIAQFSQWVNIPFKKESLSWGTLDSHFPFEREWNFFKPLESSLHWYSEVMHSTSFSNHGIAYQTSKDGQPTFEEIENPEHRKFYKQLYDENLPYYKLFLEEYKRQSEADEQKPKAIYLISTPRSCSTAFLRMMHARGDFEILIEPGRNAFRSLHFPHIQKPLQTYCDTEETILQKSRKSKKLLFVKEMGFMACKYLFPTSYLLSQQDYHVVFLIRNPHHAVLSYAKVMEESPGRGGFTQEIKRDCISYQNLYELFQKFKQEKHESPLIIFSEELVANPHKIVSQFCQHAEIPFKEEYLSWQKLDENFPFESEWECPYPRKIALHWYDKAIASTGFNQENLPSYAVDEQGQPTFEEIENLEHRAFYKQLYDENVPFYKLFLDEYYQNLKA